MPILDNYDGRMSKQQWRGASREVECPPVANATGHARSQSTSESERSEIFGPRGRPRPICKSHDFSIRQPLPSYYDEYFEEFGTVRFYRTEDRDYRTKKTIYVPQFVSAIKVSQRTIIENLPASFRRVFFKNIPHEPEVLTTRGPIGLSQAQKQYALGRVSPTMRLAPHPLVPVGRYGSVDLLAILEMNQRIAARRCYPAPPERPSECCGAGSYENVNVDEDESEYSASQSSETSSAVAHLSSPSADRAAREKQLRQTRSLGALSTVDTKKWTNA